MNSPDSPWTSEEITLLATPGLSNAEIALRTGRSQAAIRGKRQRLAKSAGLPEASSSSGYEQDKARASVEFWKREHDALKKKYERALKEQSAIEQLVASAKELAPIAYSPLPPVARLSAGEGKPQSAVLFLSDTHVGQVVRPEQTLGFGGYDFETFLARLKFYEEAVTSILRDHTTTQLSELVFAFGGLTARCIASQCGGRATAYVIRPMVWGGTRFRSIHPQSRAVGAQDSGVFHSWQSYAVRRPKAYAHGKSALEL